MNKRIVLKFDNLEIYAELFNNKIAEKFYKNLPYEIDLTKWGNELYGSININLGEDNPVPTIQEGGLAYTNRGNYFCIFFGQDPAWEVEYIGQIEGNTWEKLINKNCKTVSIRKI